MTHSCQGSPTPPTPHEQNTGPVQTAQIRNGKRPRILGISSRSSSLYNGLFVFLGKGRDSDCLQGIRCRPVLGLCLISSTSREREPLKRVHVSLRDSQCQPSHPQKNPFIPLCQIITAGHGCLFVVLVRINLVLFRNTLENSLQVNQT